MSLASGGVMQVRLKAGQVCTQTRLFLTKKNTSIHELHFVVPDFYSMRRTVRFTARKGGSNYDASEEVV